MSDENTNENNVKRLNIGLTARELGIKPHQLKVKMREAGVEILTAESLEELKLS